MLLEFYLLISGSMIIGFFLQRFSSNYMIPLSLFIFSIMSMFLTVNSPPEVIEKTTSTIDYSSENPVVTTNYKTTEYAIIETIFILYFVSVAIVNALIFASSGTAEEKRSGEFVG